MTGIASSSARVRWTAYSSSIDPNSWRHGAQLALAVVIAFLVSTAFRLPESFWAVMSALIVVRPTAGSVLGAGWDRARGTTIGTACGLAGVWLQHVGVGSAAFSIPFALAIVAVIAFASAVVPAMRSAPISALIVLTSTGIAGHTALDVALLRTVEIGIGVVTGLAVSLLVFAAHARTRFDDAAARWMRTAAAHARDAIVATQTPSTGERDARAETSRQALRELAVLAVGADREARMIGALRRTGVTALRVPRARLLARTSSDVIALVRAIVSASASASGRASHLAFDPASLDDAARGRVADAIARALETSADAIEGRGRPDLASLRDLASADANIAWLATTARLLLQDLVQLSRLVAGEPHASPETP